MFTRFLSIFGLLSIFIASTAFAADEKPPLENAPVAYERNRDESWYWGFELGAGSIRYKDAGFESEVNSLADSDFVRHLTVFGDVHFLWPLSNKQTAIGVALGGVNDNYDIDIANAEISVFTSMIAFSAQHFLTSNIGDGPFVRGDFGYASSSVDVHLTNGTFSSTTVASSRSYGGWGLRAGVGYSFLLNNDTRLPVEFLWQHANVEAPLKTNAFLITAGLLF